MISIKGLNKYFNKGKQNEIHVINDVTLELPEKGMVAVFGKSGCGKTTLLNVIGGLDGFASGAVEIDGQSIDNNTDDVRNSYIGYIFQNYNLSKDESCFDNVAAALRLLGVTDEAIIEERVTAALLNVGMEKYAKRKPDTLSGGQQQRIAIARAIVKNPRIILADEPTGNLDEINTVMIMNLLKAIAKDHLVILVTHEANLVEYYCDRIIELADGSVSNVRDNENAAGFSSKDKNGIYLGELEKSELSGDLAAIDYYGEKPNKPIKLKIINDGSRVFITVDSPGVEIIDKGSEIKIHEGIFEQKEQSSGVDEIDMSKLPPIEATKPGRLFDFKAALKSGYTANFKRHKKSIRALKRCMFLFSIAVVVMASIFGVAIKDYLGARDAYSHNTFYVYTPDGSVSEKLLLAVGDDSTGIDFIKLQDVYSLNDSSISFRLGSFDSFEISAYDTDFYTNAVLISAPDISSLRLVAGRKDDLGLQDALITTKMADALIAKSSVGYISEYDDLVGIISTNYAVDGKSLRVVGIVESDESAVYMTEFSLAKCVAQRNRMSNITLASMIGESAQDGKVVLVKSGGIDSVAYPSVGDTITIQGKELLLADIITWYMEYSDWLAGEGIAKLDRDGYYAKLMTEGFPEFDPESDEYAQKLAEIKDVRYFDYFDYYYDDLDEFLWSRYLALGDFELWLYFEKEISVMKYTECDSDYYMAAQYKQQYGEYPSKTLFNLISDTLVYDLNTQIDNYMYLYENDYYGGYNGGLSFPTCLVSDNDYVELSKRVGDTHESAKLDNGNRYYETYTLVHSTDPDATKAWLERELGDLTNDGMLAIYTPDDIFDKVIEDKREEIVSSVVSLVVMMVIMSLCMYFIMRSSLMNRIKEVGIYRAIGVSKKNLIFRFLIEAAVLSTITVLFGYFAISAFIYTGYSISSLMQDVMFYPIWYAGIVLVLLVGVSLVCGILPIVFLLRKTPSEILAKYDI